MSKVQTVQATGKRYKAYKVLGVLLLILGFPVIGFAFLAEEAGPAYVGFGLSGLGFFIYIYSRIAAWWHHA